MMNDFLMLIAQLAAPTTAPGAPADLPWYGKVLRDGGVLIPAVLFFFVFYFIVIRGKKKQEAEKQKKLDSIKKGDQIETIGGLIGTVVNTDEKTVLLKVDETANVKLKFNRRAIHRVISADDAAK